MKVIIVGGGIGGLTTALSLHQAGIEAVVFEAARRVDALGLGINLQPNAVRELTELGLAGKLAEIAWPIEELAFYNRHGQRIWSEPRGSAGGYRWRQYAVNRGLLQVALFEEASARLGRERIVTGHSLVAFEQDETGVTAHFSGPDGRARIRSERGDILVGADGLHSTVRGHFYPDQKLHYAGQLMWRTSVPDAPFLSGHTMIIAGHRNQKVVAYPMQPLADGRAMLNVIAELAEPGDAPPREDWNRKVDKAQFAASFKSWTFDWLDVPKLIERAESFYEFPKIDRDPVPQWTFGRVTLMGDAAHPMQPVGSQAGSQAIVDGRVLAFHLAHDRADPRAAIRKYEGERLPPMREVALRNRAMGAEIVMDLVEERAPNGFTNIDDVLPRAEQEQRAADFKKTAGLDAQHLNERPSYSVA
jgi:2-polyprenyl-6-methoxyphenol hydroxylase-like FAD-dependent oxidoreductase